MSDHSRANACAPIGQNPERCSVQADQNHHPEALVRVSRAECCGRKENAGGRALSQGHELPLQGFDVSYCEEQALAHSP